VVPAPPGVGKDVNLTHTKLIHPINTVLKVLHALIEGITIDWRYLHDENAEDRFVHEFSEFGKMQDTKLKQLENVFAIVVTPVAFAGNTTLCKLAQLLKVDSNDDKLAADVGITTT